MLLYTIADMPRSSQALKVPNAGPDPQRTTIQGPIVYSYSSKLQTDDVTLKSLIVTSPSQLPGLEVTPYQDGSWAKISGRNRNPGNLDHFPRR